MNNGTRLFLQEVLDKDRLKLLNNLEKIKKLDFYLAGGTALALQLGHRKSIDFDFFIKGDFDENALFDKVLGIFQTERVKKTFSEKNTLYVEVNGIKISFFGYNYDLVDKLIETEYFNLASLKDIGSMKLWAIQKRATWKDYVDLYYILQKISLDELFDSFDKKYGNIVSKYLILKSLVYFDDVKNEAIVFIDKTMTIEKIKNGLVEVIRNYERNNYLL